MNGKRWLIGWLALLTLPASADEHVYSVRIADSLDVVSVRVALAAPVAMLESAAGDAGALTGLEACGGHQPRLEGPGIVTAGVSCLRYRHPLVSATTRGPRPPDGAVVTAPGRWLWLPPEHPEQRIRIELELPAGAHASVPWPDIGPRTYRLPPSPRSSTAIAVFGAFASERLTVPGTQLRVALLDSADATLDRDDMLTWLSRAAGDVAAISGRFPSPDAQIIVQPSDRGRASVPFGYVIRNGGEAVRFFVKPGLQLEDYLSDWTATHEFSHLLLPYVDAAQKWISEGFASYYQNVLLARRGVYSEQEAWQRLHRSFATAGALEDPPPLNGIAGRPFREVRMLIYWSGAAIALMADTHLRDRSGGDESLDTVLARLQRCCLPGPGTWSGETLFARLDELSPYPVFLELYRAHADAQGMPDLTRLYDELGIEPTESGVVLNERAPLAHVRQAIMRP